MTRGGAFSLTVSAAGGLTETGPITAGTITNGVSIINTSGSLTVNGSISGSGAAGTIQLTGVGYTQAAAAAVNAGAGRSRSTRGGRRRSTWRER